MTTTSGCWPKAGLVSAEEVLNLVDRMVPERLLTPQVRFFVEAVLDAG